MSWQPISKQDLANMINESVQQMGRREKALWELVKIIPQKWLEETHGKEGNGFWVIAIYGNEIIWYNDIEDGFNCSSYEKLGIINQYWCNQDDLNHVLHNRLLHKLDA